MKVSQRRTSETKKRIAAVSKELFSQKGYLATSIEDIIAASGSSKGNLYHHFKSKEGLFLYLIEEQVDEWIEHWAKKEHLYATSAEKLHGLADHSVDDFQNPLIQAAEEFSGSQTADPVIVEQIVVATNKQRDVFQSVIEEGIANREFEECDGKQITYILFALVAGLGAARYELELNELRALHHTAISVFLHGITKKEKQ
ncbi:TetR/AcrR family transcriptional regulator [Paenibacillus sp. MER TA 81-3]|uniref:TetR/AcrR family transcriptional regulator n=1 Tax=Paenibacillus sp. MER TA 81-3 TaxID=2939573 RepID=UPI00203D74F8|nr:TetR/AcrR family transcriptional regulator [Paenibacillus sp. MER TA 81-3]MCM3340071.1 TetR/AcrR family transcriptional regulator [Paenibacillus sp. MER TA 81-3]